MKLSVKNCLVAAAAIVTATVGAAGPSDAQAAAKYRIAYIARAQGDSFAAWLANENGGASEAISGLFRDRL
jgi:inositol transport system substrate-binding protein